MRPRQPPGARRQARIARCQERGSGPGPLTTMGLSALEHALLERCQRDLPLTGRPFRDVAARLGVTESGVLAALGTLMSGGMVTRVGPVFRPWTVGASTLAAMAVPASRLDTVAATVSAFPEVNHNYEREHRYNLWFVVTAASRVAVSSVLERVRAHTGLPVLDLPLEAEYHIDLGFTLARGAPERHPAIRIPPSRPAVFAADEERLVRIVQEGLPLVPQPYAAVAARAGMAEHEVLSVLGRWLTAGIVARLGLVARHRELGYGANAMVVWDAAAGTVDALGLAFARHAFVTLCYRRPRRLPDWPYNLFCMIHGRDRGTVAAQIEGLAAEAGERVAGHQRLFSRRRFKQRGARYRAAG